MDDDIEARDDALIEASAELDRQILAIPADRVFTKRAVVAGFALVVAILLAGFGAMYFSLRHITASTNEVVRQEIPALQDQVDDRDATIAEQADLLTQAVDAIVLLQGDIRALGAEPREVIIRPTTSTTEPGG